MEKAFKKRFVILMLPTLIAFIIAFIIPFVLGIYLSFTKFTTVTDAQWIGLSNYIVAFRDKDFLASLLFTVKFVLVLDIFQHIGYAAGSHGGGRCDFIFRDQHGKPHLIENVE